MSFFYLTPVKGELPVHLLEVILDNRLEYLNKILKGEPVGYNEYLVEGSVYDNVGHFMLCITVILSTDRDVQNTFLRGELELFQRRFQSFTAYELRLFSKKLLRTIKKHKNVPKFVDALEELCRHFMLKDTAQHISSVCNKNCTVHNISLNFKQCLPFVAKRLVELKNSIAIIPCSKWKQFLLILFKQNLKHRINSTNLEPLRSDPRITMFLKKVKTELSSIEKNKTSLMSKNVDTASDFFPPCMLNLHQSLRAKHRLSHSQRFYYSLFLKDIGMPIEESINFWKAEYSLSPNGHHSCCHNWDRDEKKYLYGIRHMYGLEGCRKNYASVNCQRIQSLDNASSEGGCPFKTFDTVKLVPLLKNCTQEMLLQIQELKSRNLCSKACLLYMNSTYNKTEDSDSSFNFTPVKFYLTASKVE